MFECFIGILLLVIPFCLVLRFKNKWFGISSVFIGVFSFHLVAALILQYLHIFSYPSVLICSLLENTAVTAYFIRYRNFGISLKGIKINWFVCAAFVLVFYELFSVHYFYTGIVTSQGGDIAVTNASYQYPYFSDEYIGIALTEYSIRSHSLPLANPFNADSHYTNVLVGFFAVTAELFVLLGVNPLVGYVPFAIAVGFLSCFFAYVFLRSRRVNPFSAACAVMLIPLIINGGNLPGIWSLLPFVLAFLIFLAGLIALPQDHASKKIRDFFQTYFFSCAAFVISLILYPPIVVFVAPVLFRMFFEGQEAQNEIKKTISPKIFWLASGLILSIIVVGFIAMLLTHTFSLIVRGNLSGGIPYFPIWIVMPWFALPFSILGMWVCLKNKIYTVLAAVSAGLIYWIAYSHVTDIFIIDYSRIVSMTSFLIILLAGFGINFLIEKIPQKIYVRRLFLLQILILAVFVVIAVSYPSESWAKLVLKGNVSEGEIVAPASPVTYYLTPDDLGLFSGIEGKWFIAPPWKGLVIAAATHNFPLNSKAATLTQSLYSYDDFIALDCDHKSAVAGHFSLSYVYAAPFSCTNFIMVGSSTEGFYLYKFIGYNK